MAKRRRHDRHALHPVGGHGTISVTANVTPALMHQMCAAALEGNAVSAREINARLFGLHRDLFPIRFPSKWAVAKMGLMEHGIRPPLTPLTEASHGRVLAAMGRPESTYE